MSERIDQAYRTEATTDKLWWLDAVGYPARRIAKMIADMGILLVIEPGDTAQDDACAQVRTQIQASLRRRDLHFQTWAPLAQSAGLETTRFELDFAAEVVRQLPCCLMVFGKSAVSVERLAERIATSAGLCSERLVLPRRL